MTSGARQSVAHIGTLIARWNVAPGTPVNMQMPTLHSSIVYIAQTTTRLHGHMPIQKDTPYYSTQSSATQAGVELYPVAACTDRYQRGSPRHCMPEGQCGPVLEDPVQPCTSLYDVAACAGLQHIRLYNPAQSVSRVLSYIPPKGETVSGLRLSQAGGCDQPDHSHPSKGPPAVAAVAPSATITLAAGCCS